MNDDWRLQIDFRDDGVVDALQDRRRGDRIPVLKWILAALDEELLIGIERRVPDQEPGREGAPVPELAAT
jgi:hypothetical protein